MAAKILNDPGLAAFVVGETRGGEPLGVAAVVHVAVVFQARQNLIDVGGAFGAEAQFFAKLAGGIGTARDNLQCVFPQRAGGQTANFAFLHDRGTLGEYTENWRKLTAFLLI